LNNKAFENDYAFFALLEVVPERAFLVSDKVALNKQSACVKLVKIGRKEPHNYQKNVEDHPQQGIVLTEVFVL
jgi:hypothetical protein